MQTVIQIMYILLYLQRLLVWFLFIEWMFLNNLYIISLYLIVYIYYLFQFISLVEMYIYSVVEEFWQVLAKDPSLCDQVLSASLEKLKQGMPYEDNASGDSPDKKGRVATQTPLAVSKYPS